MNKVNPAYPCEIVYFNDEQHRSRRKRACFALVGLFLGSGVAAAFKLQVPFAIRVTSVGSVALFLCVSRYFFQRGLQIIPYPPTEPREFNTVALNETDREKVGNRKKIAEFQLVSLALGIILALGVLFKLKQSDLTKIVATLLGAAIFSFGFVVFPYFQLPVPEVEPSDTSNPGTLPVIDPTESRPITPLANQPADISYLGTPPAVPSTVSDPGTPVTNQAASLLQETERESDNQGLPNPQDPGASFYMDASEDTEDPPVAASTPKK
ncbi:MAG: hypothetical protein LVR00_01375 [Rhabdochlamydiaceae bacterium]